MMRMNIKLLYIVVLCLAPTACNTRPDYVIDEDTMTDLLVDVHMSEGLLDVQGRQMSDHKNYGQEVMAAVLLKHGVTRAQYDTSLVWYSQNLKRLIRIYNNVDKELQARSEEWSLLANQQKTGAMSISGDNVDVWALDRSLLMDEVRLSHTQRWIIPTDTCFYPGDTLRWKFHLCAMPEGQGVVASMALLAENDIYHTDDYLAGASSEPLCRDTTIVLTVAADGGMNLRKMTLSLNLIHTSRPDSLGLSPALIDSLELVRIHKK